jgi:hypothetical protein
MKSKFFSTFVISTFTLTALTTACSYGPWEDDDRNDNGTIIIGNPTPAYPDYPDDSQNECDAVWSSTYKFDDGDDETTYKQSKYMCYDRKPARYMTSCAAEDCSQVPVFVHYGLGQNLGENFTVHVEAFDNANFNGYPVGKVEVSHFKAETGSWKETELWLPEGNFYIRAFLSNKESPNMPYNFGDMVLIRDQPVGVFGVLSGAEVVHVDYRKRYTDPVSVHLDQLFKKPGSEPETNARLRTIVKFPADQVLVAGKEVRVELHKTIDFEAAPVAAMTIKSELFMIQGQLGKAEVVSQSLEIGAYFVRIYFDENQNNFYDEGEMDAVFGGAVPERVSIEKDHTRTVTLELKKD